MHTDQEDYLKIPTELISPHPFSRDNFCKLRDNCKLL